MDVILLERVEKLGQMGDLVKVKPGYARNFLIPQKKALRANGTNRKIFEERRVQLEADNLELRSEAEAAAKKMEGADVTLIRQAGEAGQLYGSVSARDVAAALTEAGFTIARTQVVLIKPIKTIGLFDIDVRLHPEVSVRVSANVARSVDEAETQIKTGKAVISAETEAAADAAAQAEAEAQAREDAAPDLDEVFEDGAAPDLDGDESADESADETADETEGGDETVSAPVSAPEDEGGETPAEPKT